MARLEPGVSLEQAEAGLEALARAPETDWRPRDKFTGQIEDLRLVVASAATGLSTLRGQFSQPLFILLGVAGIVLLVACANVGSLLLARAAARRPEFALRLALGAGRSRLFRQVLVEAGVLALLGAAAGVALAFWSTQALVAYSSAGRGAIELDLVAGPAGTGFHRSGVDRSRACCSAVRQRCVRRGPSCPRTAAGIWRRRDTLIGGRGPGRTLVVSQVALSLVLLFGAGLFVRSLQHSDPSRERRRSGARPRRSRRASRQRRAPRSWCCRPIRSHVSGVDRSRRTDAWGACRRASRGPRRSHPARIGFPVAPATGGEPADVPALIVYPRYFPTMGIPIVKGRDFNDADLQPGSPFAVLVNEAFVREFLGGREPLGVQHGLKEARLVGRGGNAAPLFKAGRPLNIIGVVEGLAVSLAARRDAADGLSDVSPGQHRLRPDGPARADLAPSAPRSPGKCARRCRRSTAIVPMFDIHTLADEVAGALLRERLVATLSGVFGVVALALVSVGLYGLLAFTVARRTAEIGIRVALGATRADVRWLIVRQALAIVGVGLAVGVPAAWIASRLVSRQLDTLLFEQTPNDPIDDGRRDRPAVAGRDVRRPAARASGGPHRSDRRTANRLSAAAPVVHSRY